MIPIFATARAAVLAVAGFLRFKPLLLLCAIGAYAVLFLVRSLVLPQWHLDGKTGGFITDAFGDLPTLILLVPVWTALARFVILRDRARGYFPIDVRVRRVLVTSLVLALISLIGGLVFAFALDVGPRMQERRMLALALLGAAVGWKCICWWLGARLAIAPALAAAGARKEALDTSFAYTSGAVFGILLLKLVIYTPAFVLVGILFAVNLRFGIGTALQFGGVAFATLLNAVTDVVDVAAMSLVAVRLVRLRTAKTKPE